MTITQPLHQPSADNVAMAPARRDQSTDMGTPHGPRGTENDIPGLSLVGALNMILRQRRLVVTVTGVVLAGAISLTLLRRAYSSTSVFMPRAAQRATSGLAGIAAQFGIPLNGGNTDESVTLYAELPTSREILRELAMTEFRFALRAHPTDTIRGTPIDLLDVHGDTPLDRLNNTIDALSERVSATPDLNAGLVLLRVTAPSRELAELINRRVLDLVSEFNLKRRQSQAAAERRFLEARMSEARRSLDSAETALQDFLNQNRQHQESPRLTFEAARLQRRIDIQQEVYLSLAKSYESARIEEVRNTPVITIVDPPENSAQRAGGGLMLNGLLGIVIGGVLALAIAFVKESFVRQRTLNPSEYAEFLALRHATLGRLLRGRRKS
jgi:uncharacterized protein involved in exopolysaccharide biosynthesis